MRLDKLSASAAEAFQAAMGVAGDNDASIIEPIHLLAAVLDASENNLEAILKRVGADPAQLKRNVADAVAAKPKSTGGMAMAMPGNDLLKVIDQAVKTAERMGDSYATTEHLLIALAGDKGEAGKILNAAGATAKAAEAEARRRWARIDAERAEREAERARRRNAGVEDWPELARVMWEVLLHG